MWVEISSAHRGSNPVQGLQPALPMEARAPGDWGPQGILPMEEFSYRGELFQGEAWGLGRGPLPWNTQQGRRSSMPDST